MRILWVACIVLLNNVDCFAQSSNLTNVMPEDPGLICHDEIKSCTYQLLNAGRVDINELMERARKAVAPAAPPTRLSQDIGRIEKGRDDSEVFFWSEDAKIRVTMAKALIIHDSELSKQTEDVFFVEAMVYAIREEDVNDFFLGLDGGIAITSNETSTDLLGETSLAAATGGLVGYIANKGSAKLKLSIEAAFTEGKAQKWINRVQVRRSGDGFHFNTTQNFYIDGVANTQMETSGFNLSGSFYKSRSGTYHLDQNAAVFLGTKPNDKDLTVNGNSTGADSETREGVTMINQPIDRFELKNGAPTIVFDETVVIERKKSGLGTFVKKEDSNQRARLLVFLTISNVNAYNQSQSELTEIYSTFGGAKPQIVESNSGNPKTTAPGRTNDSPAKL